MPLRVAFVNQLRSGMLRAADSRMRDSTLTLLQVLLVVPRFLLFGHEFLHCAGAEHGTDRSALEKQAPPCVCASVCEYGLEQWSSERQRRRLLQGGAASAPAGWGVLLLRVGASSTCFLLSLIRSLPPFIPSTAWSVGAADARTPTDVAAVLQQQHFLLSSSSSLCYQLRPRGAFTCRSSDARPRFSSHTRTGANWPFRQWSIR